MRATAGLLFLMLGACMVGEGDGEESATEYDPADHVDDGDVPEMDDALVRAAQAPIRNPVVRDCADPGVMRDGATWYMTCTGGAGGNHFATYTTTDLRTWTKAGAIFPADMPATRKPTWATGDWWAPELHHVPGGFAAFYSATEGNNHSLGVAFSQLPVNPNGYNDPGHSLLNQAGSLIDVHSFTAPDKRRYLIYKIEGNPDTIWGRRLKDDGINLASDAPVKLLSATLAWEKNVVEAPWIVKLGDWFYMFYSGAVYCNESYGVGVARAKSPLGPWEKKPNPILASGDKWVAPGHNSFTFGPDRTGYIVYHAYNKNEGTPKCGENPPGTDNNARHVLISRVVLKNGWPKVQVDL